MVDERSMSVSAEAKAIRKRAAQYDLFNRLHSIAADEAFVRLVAQDWFEGRFDVVANQRCGNWYCDPLTSSTAYAYFKSTDGHTNNLDFNLRRSNLPFATAAASRGGVLLVDSTRRGKRMPDALSKTVPVWCAVINRAVGLDPTLYLPPNIVSPSESSQIAACLGTWVDALKASSLPLPKLEKPLRPFFIHPSTSQPPVIPLDPPYTPVICVSASRWQGDDLPSATRVGTRTVGFEYVPGAGDDDELWGRGLTPRMFHQHKLRLLETDRDELAGVVDALVDIPMESLSLQDSTTATAISPRLALHIGPPVAPAQCTPAPTTTLHVVVLDKHREPRLRRIPGGAVLALPSARSDGPGFSSAMHEAVQFVRGVPGTVLICPGHQKLLDIPPLDNQTPDPPLDNQMLDPPLDNPMPDPPLDNQMPDSQSLDKPLVDSQSPDNPLVDDPAFPSLDPAAMVDARKGILPLALVLLCTTDAAAEMTKPYIASHLHTLVAQWPDGNPPRAALKRVNEYLMSPGRYASST